MFLKVLNQRTQMIVDKFHDKYGIHFRDLVEIPHKISEDYNRTNYRIMYDKSTDRCFSLWQTPYHTHIRIENEGFIIQDDSIREEYAEYIKTHF